MRKSGIITRIKVSMFFIFRNKGKEAQIMTCEHCGSLDIKKIPNTEKVAATGTAIVYGHKYQCQNCRAECTETQLWEKKGAVKNE